ncbi:MAG: hypothetical protein INR68_09015 [Methylobacterium mesophilicum]|nr:hypothetical protein [Methylobacterium mesophilicum]
MSLTPLGVDDFNHTKWLDLKHKLSDRFSPFVARAAFRMTKGDTVARGDVARANRAAIEVILGNIVRNNSLDRSIYTIIEQRNHSYPKDKMENPFEVQIRALRRVLDYFMSDGVSYLERRGGNFDLNIKAGYTFRYRATDNLFKDLRIFEEHLIIKNEAIGSSLESSTYPINGNTLTNNPNSIRSKTLYETFPQPLIRMRSSREEGKKLITFDHTDETKAMERKLQTYNTFLDDHWIDIAQTDEAMLKAIAGSSSDPSQTEESHGCLPDLVFSNHLYRVFNEGSFTKGGRFYGGWWQTIPSKLRKWITIDWHPTAELDFSNMQIIMLYARAGAQLTGDAYEIEGIPGSYRSLLKTTLLRIINAKGKMRAPEKSDLPDGWTWQAVLDAVRERHEPIAKFFSTGIGLELQRIDSDIAEQVMLELMTEGIVALPVHDSFIVPLGKEDRLKSAMLKAFAEHAGAEIRVDADSTWLDDLVAVNPEVIELDDLDVRHVSDFWQDHFDDPGFERFKQRQSDFLAVKGEAWGHNHSFVPL